MNLFFTLAFAFIFIPTLLLLQKIAYNLNSHLHVSCHFIFFVSLVLDIKLNTLMFKSFTTSGTYFYVWIINIITIATAFICFNAEWIKYRIITNNINNFLLYMVDYSLKYNSMNLYLLSLIPLLIL